MSDEVLAMLYATYIMSGDRTYESVPQLLKPQVKEILEREGLGELAE